MAAGFEVFAPGSLCLFGERDAPYGSAILLAIDRGARARVTPRPGSRKLEVELPQFGFHGVVSLDADDGGMAVPGDAPEVFGSIVAELVELGARWTEGAHLEVRNDLPIGGCGATAAMSVATVRALVELAGDSARRLAEPRRIADLKSTSAAASPPEALASALGGLHYVNFGATPFVQELPVKLADVVLIETGDSREAMEAARESARTTRSALIAAVRSLQAREPGLDLASVSLEAVWNLLVDVASSEADPAAAATRERLLFATLFGRDTLHAALRFLSETPVDFARLGELIDEHHARIRDELGLSTPRIEELRRAAAAAGAFGSRVEGDAGERLFALAPGRTIEVVAAVERLGAKATVVRPSAGVTLRPLA